MNNTSHNYQATLLQSTKLILIKTTDILIIVFSVLYVSKMNYMFQ